MFKQDICEYLKSLKGVNTHSHHMNDAAQRGLTLRGLLQNSYTSWVAPPPEKLGEVRAYIEKNYCNSYFRWLFAALEELYGLPFNADNFNEIDARLRRAHENDSYHLDVLKNRCGYQSVLLDYYPHPGSDNGHADIFIPVLRCNMFAVCSNLEDADHNGNNAFAYMAGQFDSFENYLAAVEEKIRGYKAVKFALAYDGDNDISNFDEAGAKRAFMNKDATAKDRKAYYDYMVYRLCLKAGELNIPVQFHTGTGRLDKSSPLYLRTLAEACGSTKFAFFHGGFPWTDDALAMVNAYANVYLDICWLPLLSSSVAARFIRDALEVTDAHRLMWGCDTWTAEESMGAAMAGREAISLSLSKMVEDGAIEEKYALYAAARIWRENAADLYRL